MLNIVLGPFVQQKQERREKKKERKKKKNREKRTRLQTLMRHKKKRKEKERENIKKGYVCEQRRRHVLGAKNGRYGVPNSVTVGFCFPSFLSDLVPLSCASLSQAVQVLMFLGIPRDPSGQNFPSLVFLFVLSFFLFFSFFLLF